MKNVKSMTLGVLDCICVRLSMALTDDVKIMKNSVFARDLCFRKKLNRVGFLWLQVNRAQAHAHCCVHCVHGATCVGLQGRSNGNQSINQVTRSYQFAHAIFNLFVS